MTSTHRTLSADGSKWEPSRSDMIEGVRVLAEWAHEYGPVLWWKFPIDEPPYVGTPDDLGQVVEVHTFRGVVSTFTIGGWPGYHTHWTPITYPAESHSSLSALEGEGK